MDTVGVFTFISVIWCCALETSSFKIDAGSFPLAEKLSRRAPDEGKPTSPQVYNLQEGEILSHLAENGGIDTNIHRPSTEFMIKIFKDLLRGQPLADAVGHTDRRTKPEVTVSDTIRSFSPYYSRRTARFRYSIPLLAKHEQLRMAEVRFGSVSDRSHVTQNFTLVAQRGGKTLEKIRFSKLRESGGNDTIYDLTSVLSSILAKHPGNVTLELRIRGKRIDRRFSRDTSRKTDSSEPILVFYSQDKGFLKSMMTSVPALETSGVSSESRRRRSTRKRRKKDKKNGKWHSNKTDGADNLCRMHDFKVNFDLIGWGPWIIHPKTFNAHVCYGECPEPIGHEYSPTNHAMLQALMRMKRPLSAPATCCVPTKLRPLSMLYFEYDDIVVRHHQDMVVGECGCR